MVIQAVKTLMFPVSGGIPRTLPAMTKTCVSVWGTAAAAAKTVATVLSGCAHPDVLAVLVQARVIPMPAAATGPMVETDLAAQKTT